MWRLVPTSAITAFTRHNPGRLENPLENKSKSNHLTFFAVYQRLEGTVRHSLTLSVGPCAAARHDFGLATRKGMHYHIRWSDSKLDWKPFSTREEAEQAARRLARRGETFTVEYADDKTCMERICERMVFAKRGMAN